MSGVSAQTVDFSRALAHVDHAHIGVRRAVRDASIVVAPLVIGYALGLTVPAVLVTVGTLNLLLVAPAYPANADVRVLAVACASNATAFGAGTLVGLLPKWIGLPLIGLGLFLAVRSVRRLAWEGASFIAAVMFAFAVGIPPAPGPIDVLLRPTEIFIGGILGLGALIALTGASRILGRPGPPAPAPVVAGERSSRVATEHAAVVAITATLGLLVGLELGLPRDYWVMLTVLVALRYDLGGTVSYSVARTGGTVIGAGVAFVVTTLTASPWWLFPTLALAAFFAYATRGANYLLYSLGITLTIIVLLNLAYSGGPELAIARVIDTAIGGSLALVAAFLLWEAHARNRPMVPGAA